MSEQIETEIGNGVHQLNFSEDEEKLSRRGVDRAKFIVSVNVEGSIELALCAQIEEGTPQDESHDHAASGSGDNVPFWVVFSSQG
jgi:hypothetical protein